MIGVAQSRFSFNTTQGSIRQSFAAVSRFHRVVGIQKVIGKTTFTALGKSRFISQNIVPNARCVLLEENQILSSTLCEQRYEFYHLNDVEILLNRSIRTRRIDNVLSADERDKSQAQKITEKTLHDEILLDATMN